MFSKPSTILTVMFYRLKSHSEGYCYFLSFLLQESGKPLSNILLVLHATHQSHQILFAFLSPNKTWWSLRKKTASFISESPGPSTY